MVFLWHGLSSFSHHDPHHADVYRISRWVEFDSSACRLRYRILRPTEGMLISGWGALVCSQVGGGRARTGVGPATMIGAADRWCRVSISNLERHRLTRLRAELGLDPPPASTDDRKTNRRKDITT
jgi:hypothetical protein